MNKFIIVLIFITSFSLLSKAQKYSSIKRETKKIVVDGKNLEWGQIFNYFDQETGFMYSMLNNNKEIILCFKSYSEFKMKRLIRAGWKIELISKEKDNKFETAIIFPPMQLLGVSGKPSFEVKSNSTGIIDNYILQRPLINVSGFKSFMNLQPLPEKGNIELALGADNITNLFCEIKIPLSELSMEENITFNEKMLMKVTVERLTVDLGTPQKSKQDNQVNSMGQHGLGNGRMHRQNQYETNSSPVIKKSKLKHKFSLAKE